jgi:hypothetical protein
MEDDENFEEEEKEEVVCRTALMFIVDIPTQASYSKSKLHLKLFL